MWATMASVELIGNFRVKLMNNSKIEEKLNRCEERDLRFRNEHF